MPQVKLRQDNVRTLQYVGDTHAKSQCIYWDLSLPGFGLRKFPNGRGSYVCGYRVQKRKRLVDLGRSDSMTLEQARRKARLYFGTAADGKDPKSNIDEMRASATVKMLADLYVKRHAKPKKRTWKADESCLNHLFIPKFGSHLASSITRADVASVHADFGKEHPYAANRFVAIVRKMYNVGRQLGMVPEDMPNPGTEIERFPEHKRRRYVTPAEMPVLAAAIDDDPNEFAGHALWLLLLTGIRRNELLAAKWADVDWDNKTLYIGKTKNGDPVLTPLSRAAIARLKVIPKLKDNPHIICGAIPGKPLAYLDAMWRRIRKETGFQDLRIHDLRRTVGSWLVRDGASLHLVGAVLNHKDQKTTAGYAYFQTEDRQEVLNRHGNKIVQIAKGNVRRRLNQSPEVSVPTRDKTKKLPRVRRIARKDLYKLIWSEPITSLAERFGISDVGLAKVCRRSDIPAPPRGYWAKVTAGGTLQRPALPERPDLRLRAITFRINRNTRHQNASEPR
ncbi:MAG TPA: site-specific integrase [Xanthobacteraceae bacterium]|nr:site-specific integrase [Xanthobacteraceae bacterium]